MLACSAPAVLLSLRTKHVKHADYLDNSVMKVTETSYSNFTFCVHESVFFSGAHTAFVNYVAVDTSKVRVFILQGPTTFIFYPLNLECIAVAYSSGFPLRVWF